MRRLLMLVTVALCAFFSAAPVLQQTAVVMHSPVTSGTAVAISHPAGVASSPQILCPNGMPLPC